MKKMRLLLPLLLTLVLFTSVQAQESGITITLVVPQFMEDIVTDELLARFEAENPGVNVHVEASGFGVGGSPAVDIEDYLENMTEYASSGDVLFADSSFAPEATRAGLFLDLAPLTSSDTSLNVNDFYPAAWNSFQWDSGVWALPISFNITTLTYNPEAFDEAGIPYPNEAWTLDDLANAARALTETDANGNISKPGLIVMEGAALARSLLGIGLYDASTFPETPNLTHPALETLLTNWIELEEEGIVARQYSGNLLDVPMRIGGILRFGGLEMDTIADALLPGGTAVIEAQGFAVSSGTQYPEQAYALAKFLTTRPEVTNSFFGIRPARQSLVGVQPELQAGPGVFIGLGSSPEQDAFIDSAIAVALPMSELRYGEYLNAALTSISEGVDAATALQDAENSVIANLQTAADYGETTTVMVATPPPPVVLGEGEVSLNFGIISFIQPLPNEALWNQLVEEFVASDPQVGEIVLDLPGGRFVSGGSAADSMAEQYDCFYLPYNNVPELDTSTVLNLDPYLDADPTFDRNDVVGNVLSQVQQNAMTWALPITIQPQVLSYSPDRFAEAGAVLPEDGWTTDEFVSALQALKTITEDDPPFQSQGPGGNYLLMLIAAFGGLPLDYRTDPVTINFTDPATVEAIRQVLDLAKEGLIDYQEQVQGGAIAITIQVGPGDDLPPITTQSFLGFGDLQIRRIGENPYQMTSYPTGTRYTPLVYDITTGYISATSENPDACYRWLSTLARHPELFNGMPARRSLLSDPAVVAALGQDTVDFYSQFDALLQSPNAVTFPSPFAGARLTSFILQSWLNRAFDNYVLRDGDLEADLADAQIYATAYQECVANLPPSDPATDGPGALQQIQECVTAADPSMSGFFGGR